MEKKQESFVYSKTILGSNSRYYKLRKVPNVSLFLLFLVLTKVSFAYTLPEKVLFETHVRYVEGILSQKQLPARCLQYSKQKLARSIVQASWEAFVYAGSVPVISNQDSFLALILAVIEIESSFCTKAVSHKGAVGLMQINYSYWKKRYPSLKKQKLFEPYFNVRFGANLLFDVLQRRGLVQGLCEYHGDRSCKNLGYVEKIVRLFLMHERNLAKLAGFLSFLTQESSLTD